MPSIPCPLILSDNRKNCSPAIPVNKYSENIWKSNKYSAVFKLTNFLDWKQYLSGLNLKTNRGILSVNICMWLWFQQAIEQKKKIYRSLSFNRSMRYRSPIQLPWKYSRKKNSTVGNNFRNRTNHELNKLLWRNFLITVRCFQMKKACGG